MWPLEVFLFKIAANAPRYITNNKIELLSFLQQNIVTKLLEEASRQNRDKRDPLVIAAVVNYFNLALALHGLFYNTVHQIAHSFSGEWFSTFKPVHVTPQWKHVSCLPCTIAVEVFFILTPKSWTYWDSHFTQPTSNDHQGCCSIVFKQKSHSKHKDLAEIQPFAWFSGELNHTLYNVWLWKITWRHQEAKCMNVSLKVFYLFDFGHVWFFHSLLGCSWCTMCQKNKLLILCILQPKNQYGWHGEIGVWLYKWLYSTEMVDICSRKCIEKM